MRAAEALRRLGERRPLVHHITNYVSVGLVANATLCTGALPVMAHAREEVAEMSGAAGALVLNIGTLDERQVESMLAAGKSANERGIPVILDPVGAGATRMRTLAAERLLSELEVSAVCGNAGEIATLAGLSAEVRGVESIGGDAGAAAREAAASLGVTVAATGPVDHVCGGGRALAVENGHPLLGRVVGSGCASTAVIGCFAAAAGSADPETVAHALAYFGCAGEEAARTSGGPGTFEGRLLDALAAFAADPSVLSGQLRVSDVG